LIFPSFDDIVDLNNQHIKRTGGKFVPPNNLRNPSGLEWVLNSIQYPLFSIDLYPTLASKAGILCYVIIQDHVFWDGNKRTGTASMINLIVQNDYLFEALDDEIIEFARVIAEEHIAQTTFSQEEITRWIQNHTFARHPLINLGPLP
jgi:death-on-curing protein